jgi:hypothetical protein
VAKKKQTAKQKRLIKEFSRKNEGVVAEIVPDDEMAPYNTFGVETLEAYTFLKAARDCVESRQGTLSIPYFENVRVANEVVVGLLRLMTVKEFFSVERLREAEGKIIRNPGKPNRNKVVRRLHREGYTPSQIGRHPELIKANDGKRMSRQNVQNIVRKGGQRID